MMGNEYEQFKQLGSELQFTGRSWSVRFPCSRNSDVQWREGSVRRSLSEYPHSGTERDVRRWVPEMYRCVRGDDVLGCGPPRSFENQSQECKKNAHF